MTDIYRTYGIVHIPTAKVVYIGQWTVGPAFPTLEKKGKYHLVTDKSDKPLQNAIRVEGRQNFKIIELSRSQTKAEMKQLEREQIQEYSPQYNTRKELRTYSDSKAAKDRKGKLGSYAKLYSVYSQVKARCYDSNVLSYPNYGGRGIKVHESWLLKPNTGWENFKTWALDNGYEADKGLTLDRIDSDSDYSPSNCRWIPKSKNVRGPGRKR